MSDANDGRPTKTLRHDQLIVGAALRGRPCVENNALKS